MKPNTEQESCAVTRKPCDAAAVLFALKSADNYKFKSIAKLRKPDFRAANVPAQNRIYCKMAILGHSRSRVGVS